MAARSQPTSVVFLHKAGLVLTSFASTSAETASRQNASRGWAGSGLVHGEVEMPYTKKRREIFIERKWEGASPDSDNKQNNLQIK